jgi:hypothetical protein
MLIEACLCWKRYGRSVSTNPYCLLKPVRRAIVDFLTMIACSARRNDLVVSFHGRPAIASNCSKIAAVDQYELTLLSQA